MTPFPTLRHDTNLERETASARRCILLVRYVEAFGGVLIETEPKRLASHTYGAALCFLLSMFTVCFTFFFPSGFYSAVVCVSENTHYSEAVAVGERDFFVRDKEECEEHGEF